MHRFKRKRKVEFQEIRDAVLASLHHTSLYPPALHKAEQHEANVSYPQGNLLGWEGFVFIFQVWDWLALKERLHSGGRSEAAGASTKAVQAQLTEAPHSRAARGQKSKEDDIVGRDETTTY